jgi:hypothetical protein
MTGVGKTVTTVSPPLAGEKVTLLTSVEFGTYIVVVAGVVVPSTFYLGGELFLTIGFLVYNFGVYPCLLELAADTGLLLFDDCACF